MSPDELEEFGRRSGDGRDRDRISVLAEHFARIARKLDERERRVERAVRVLQVGGALLIVLGFVGWLALREQARETDRVADDAKQALVQARQARTGARRVAAEQTRARYRSVYTGCLERNKTNDGIVRYLRSFGADADDIRQARRYFPDEPNCKDYTIALLGKDVPEGAFRLPQVLKKRAQTP